MPNSKGMIMISVKITDGLNNQYNNPILKTIIQNSFLNNNCINYNYIKNKKILYLF